MNDATRVLLQIAKLALNAVDLEVPPPPTEIVPDKPSKAERKKYTRNLAPKASGSKRTGFPPGSKFYICDDCGRGFASTESALDVTCKHCGSIHVKPRERKQVAEA